jgi:DNA-binding MarR family transcriptional regulator
MLLIELTDTGRKVARDFRPIVHQHEKVWLGALSEKEQRQLIDLLDRIQATLTAGSGIAKSTTVA